MPVSEYTTGRLRRTCYNRRRRGKAANRWGDRMVKETVMREVSEVLTVPDLTERNDKR